MQGIKHTEELELSELPKRINQISLHFMKYKPEDLPQNHQHVHDVMMDTLDFLYKRKGMANASLEDTKRYVLKRAKYMTMVDSSTDVAPNYKGSFVSLMAYLLKPIANISSSNRPSQFEGRTMCEDIKQLIDNIGTMENKYKTYAKDFNTLLMRYNDIKFPNKQLC